MKLFSILKSGNPEREALKENLADLFNKIQSGWGRRDFASIAPLLTPEMSIRYEREIGRLRAESKTNRIEKIAIQSIDIERIWKENGSDFVAAAITGELLDYIQDDRTGAIESGSSRVPVSFCERWTFCGLMGSGTWTLCSIQKV
jgi:predicted lipid-binding transport protein (Tim44 family)